MRYRMLAVLLAFIPCFDAQTNSRARISGPYTHENLSVFLIRGSAPPWAQGSAKASTMNYLTLQKAMDQKVVAVHETNQVRELAVENISASTVFMQQGDILKGGKQDRMVTNDFLLPPKSGSLPIRAFCVEQGRWGQRGREPAAAFAGSTELGAISFDPRSMWDQMSVWSKVSALQEALASRLHHNGGTAPKVRAAASPTSLTLTQTSPPVEDAVGQYTRTLADVVQGKIDVIGYAFAINGTLRGAHIYASPSMFASMWPKLLRATAVEALRLPKHAFTPPSEASLTSQLLQHPGGKVTTTDLDGRTVIFRWEGGGTLAVETRDRTAWVHRTVLWER